MEKIYIILTAIIILNLIIFFNYKLLFKKINIYDFPVKDRKIHTTPVPLTGGIILYINLIVLYFFLYLFREENLINDLYIFSEKNFIIFIFIQSAIFMIGLYDDKYQVNASSRLILFTIFICILCLADNTLLVNRLIFSFTSYELSILTLSIPFSIFCIIAFIVSINMFDGINLQVSIFYLFSLIFIILKTQNLIFLTFIIPLILVIILNYRNKLFLGDSGSYLVAFLISFFFLKLYIDDKTIFSDHIFLVLLLPVLDASRVIIERVIKGYPVFKGDQNHLQHILLKNYKYKKSILIISCLYFLPYLAIYLKFNSLLMLIFIFSIYGYLIYRR